MNRSLVISYNELRKGEDKRLSIWISKWKETAYEFHKEENAISCVWKENNHQEVLNLLKEGIQFFKDKVHIYIAPESRDCKGFFQTDSKYSLTADSMEPIVAESEPISKEESISADNCTDATENSVSVEAILEGKNKMVEAEEAIETVEEAVMAGDDVTEEIKDTKLPEIPLVPSTPVVKSSSLSPRKALLKKKKEEAPVKENKLEKKNRVAILRDFFLKDGILTPDMKDIEKISFAREKATEFGIKSKPMIEAMIYAAIDSGTSAKKMEEAIGLRLGMNPSTIMASINREYTRILKEKNPEFLDTYGKKTTAFDFLNIFRTEDNYF